MSSRPWIKLWLKWYESTSHHRLSPHALHTGPHLLALASKSGPDASGTAWILWPTGEPYSLDDLASITRWPKKTVASAVGELVKVGTLVRDGDRLGFRSWGEYQEGKSTRRTRDYRSRSQSRHNGVTVTVTGTQTERVEAEAEAEAELAQTPTVSSHATTPDRRPKRKKLPPSPTVLEFPIKGGKTWALTERALQAYRDAFPNLDVEAAIRKAKLWCETNPAKRKTANGMPGFLTRWLNGDDGQRSAELEFSAPGSVADFEAEIRAVTGVRK